MCSLASQLLPSAVEQESALEPRGADWIDRVGRLQLPQEYLTQLALRNLVRLELETDHVQVHPTGEDEDDS